jgi:hypothetical protein
MSISVHEIVVSTAKIGALEITCTLQSVVNRDGHTVLVGLNEFVSVRST